MTVKELKEQLDKFPDNAIILIPSDDDYVPATYAAIGCNDLDGFVFIDGYDEE